MYGKHLRKIIQLLSLIVCILKTWRCIAYISEYNTNGEKQVTLLMIPDE